MEQGLIWLPLLALFIGLAWAGWHEYQKLAAYQEWAKAFQQAKYDIYAVLGYDGMALTWGQPTRQGPVNLQTIPLQQVLSLQAWVNQQPIDSESCPQQGQNIEIAVVTTHSPQPLLIRFTEVSLALKWKQYLQDELHKLSRYKITP
jgi:hypothetical protein